MISTGHIRQVYLLVRDCSRQVYVSFQMVILDRFSCL